MIQSEPKGIAADCARSCLPPPPAPLVAELLELSGEGVGGASAASGDPAPVQPQPVAAATSWASRVDCAHSAGDWAGLEACMAELTAMGEDERQGALRALAAAMPERTGRAVVVPPRPEGGGDVAGGAASDARPAAPGSPAVTSAGSVAGGPSPAGPVARPATLWEAQEAPQVPAPADASPGEGESSVGEGGTEGAIHEPSPGGPGPQPNPPQVRGPRVRWVSPAGPARQPATGTSAAMVAAPTTRAEGLQTASGASKAPGTDARRVAAPSAHSGASGTSLAAQGTAGTPAGRRASTQEPGAAPEASSPAASAPAPSSAASASTTVPSVPEPPAWPRVSAAPTPPDAILMADADEFRRLLAATEGAPVVGLDTETTGLDPHADRVRTVQIATGEAAWVVDTWAVRDVAPLREWLAARARAGLRTVAHNAKFDLSMLRAALGGAPLAEVAVSDPMLWSQLLAYGLPVDGGHGLAAVAKRWLGIDLPKDEQKGDWTGTLRPEQVAYAARDAWTMVPLADAMWHGADGRKGIAAEGLARVAALEDACVPAVADMEYDGIMFDLPYWTALTEEIRAEAQEAKSEALRFFGPALGARGRVARHRDIFGEVAAAAEPLNLDSPAQVLAALRALGLEVASTAEGALKPLAADNPVVAALLRYKKQSKLLSGFAEALPKHVHPVTGRIHARYHQLCANGVGRFSASAPNLQQIPHDARFRRAFVAGEGRCLVVADYSQVELRIMAELSGDKRMLEAYRNGEDLHRLTASLVAGVPLDQVTKAQRQMAKAVNFGLCYGMSANGLRSYAQNSYGVSMPQEEAEVFRRRYFEAYSGVAAYHRKQDWEARRARETRTLLGRCRRWADTNMGLPELANSPDQGSAADLMKQAMVRIRGRAVRGGWSLVNIIHDEGVFEVPTGDAEAAAACIKAEMESAGGDLGLKVPIEAEVAIGQTWADKA